MKWFLDSADINEIKSAIVRGASGITTNPSIIARDGTRINDIAKLLLPGMPLSVELTTTDPNEMLLQAEKLLRELTPHRALYIKVPIGWEELRVIRSIRLIGGKVNCTAIMTYSQALMAANAGADYVSLFWNRIKDSGGSPFEIVYQVHETFRERSCPTQIIVGSIRHVDNVSQAWQAGADIVTIPPKFLSELCSHPETDKAVAQFMSDFAQSSKPKQ